MEPITQALLGATTAELVAGRALRGRALGWGAVIGMLPDLDVLLGGLHNGYGEWLYHRGTTHSLWFGFVMGPLLGWILWRWRDRGGDASASTLPAWISLSVVALVTHPLLDGFTPYGTQFFAPFIRDRFAWNGVAIVDPFYSIVLGAGVFYAAVRTRPETRRRKVLLVSFLLSSCYLLAGLGVNRWVENDLRRALASEVQSKGGGAIERVRAYPTIFQPWLRSFVIRTPETVFVGLHSWMQPGCPAWRAHRRPAPSPAIRAMTESWEGELLSWFADGDTATFVGRDPDGLTRVRIEDVRYGWASPDARGMWGLEARFDQRGQIVGKINRLDRISFSVEDLARIGRLLRGQLPEAGEGWQRPSNCPPTSG